MDNIEITQHSYSLAYMYWLRYGTCTEAAQKNPMQVYLYRVSVRIYVHVHGYKDEHVRYHDLEHGYEHGLYQGHGG